MLTWTLYRKKDIWISCNFVCVENPRKEIVWGGVKNKYIKMRIKMPAVRIAQGKDELEFLGFLVLI